MLHCACDFLGKNTGEEEYWLPFLSPGDLPNPGIKPVSCAVGRFFTDSATFWLRRILVTPVYNLILTNNIHNDTISI